MNWKISKLAINNFKAFKNIKLDFENCTLLTLEGPNGFGKTSIYDALELVFTGKIDRIQRLCNNIMFGNRINFEDNLFWNTKYEKKDIEIIIELFNQETREVFTFCRIAKVSDLETPQNNKANNFSFFKIYILNNFNENKTIKEINQEELNLKLGNNFVENYNNINYLEQGQSNFIYSKNLKERKDSINKLMNIDELSKNIQFLNKLELAISRKINNREESDRIYLLSKEIEAISKNNNKIFDAVKYTKISTINPTPIWDLEDFDFSSQQLTNEKLENIISQLLYINSYPDDLKNKINNKKIDLSIYNNQDFFDILVTIGPHIEKFPDLEAKKNKYDEYNYCLKILSKNLNEIDSELIKKSSQIISFNTEQFIKDNLHLDNLIKEQNDVDADLLKINNARYILKSTHEHPTNDLENKNCLLCDSIFLTPSDLLLAIDLKTQKLNKKNLNIYKKIDDLKLKLTEIVKKEIAILNQKLIMLDFNSPLFSLLLNHKPSFVRIESFISSLNKKQIILESEFTENPDIIKLRKDKLINLISSFKTQDSGIINDTHLETLSLIFSNYDDILKINKEVIAEKLKYFQYKQNLSNNFIIQKNTKEITEFNNKKNKLTQLKNNISNLKSELRKLNNNYSQKVISDIELTFHIYSGRLIQNYQRGLGLFIDNDDGDKLRFCTAEKSDHDATLAMSSGQLSALSLAFFLSLNKVYSNSPLVLIDDPAQSLDDINIASLSDLLRCELKDRQLLLSSHEDSISNYLRFRFQRVGLNQKPFNVQHLSQS